MPLTNPPAGSAVAVGNMGLLATTPANVATGYSWTYGTTNKAFPAYTPNVQTTAYAGNLLDLTQALRLTDGNALRVAVENLRVFTENLAQQHNAISVSLVQAGLIST
jgi:hypothetical protein